MNMTKNTIRWVCQTCVGISLLLCSGCLTPVGDYKASTTNQPVRSPIQVDATATVEVVLVARDTPNKWMTKADKKKDGANYRAALEQVLRDDIVTSGLFARIVTDGKADYAVKINWIDSITSAACAIVATETATGAQFATHSLAYPELRGSAGRTIQARRKAWLKATPAQMAMLRAELVEKIQAQKLREKEQSDQSSFLAKASLTELIIGTDKNITSARERNRAIIVAKNMQLPSLLRDSKTSDLTALVIKIEQAVLDLNHESEVANDRAQRMAAGSDRTRGSVAANGSTQGIEEVRGLAISYQERIELLKPIAAALKEEIANRNR